MKRNQTILRLSMLIVAAVAVCSQMADGGRIGGAVSDIATVEANQAVYFDIPFAVAEPAMVTIVGNGDSNLDLHMYDGDGNSTPGRGAGDRKTATMNVYRAGFFRIEVRNLGSAANTFMIMTN